MKDMQQSAKSTSATDKASTPLTEEERAALRDRHQEVKAAARRGSRADKADGERDVLAKIAEMPQPDRDMAERPHAIAAVGDHQTAFGHRDALVEFVAVAAWTDPAQDQARMVAARRYGAVVEPFASSVYVNDLTDEGGQVDIRRAYHPGTLARLAALKGRYDPGNVFHLNHNIRPRKEQPG
jgi:hypothetical protein